MVLNFVNKCAMRVLKVCQISEPDMPLHCLKRPHPHSNVHDFSAVGNSELIYPVCVDYLAGRYMAWSPLIKTYEDVEHEIMR